MKSHLILFALTLSVCGGATSLVAQPQTAPDAVPSNSPQSKQAPTFNVVITDGQLRLSAQQQEPNGLLRNVTVQTPTSFSATDPSDVTFGVNNFTRIFGQYAHRDASRPGQWLLGKGVIQHFRPDGTIEMENKFERMHLKTQPGKAGNFAFFSGRKSLDNRNIPSPRK